MPKNSKKNNGQTVEIFGFLEFRKKRSFRKKEVRGRSECKMSSHSVPETDAPTEKKSRRKMMGWFNSNKKKAKQYLHENVVPTLVTGLSQLSMHKPKDPLVWLGWFLLSRSNKCDSVNLSDGTLLRCRPERDPAAKQAAIAAAVALSARDNAKAFALIASNLENRKDSTKEVISSQLKQIVSQREVIREKDKEIEILRERIRALRSGDSGDSASIVVPKKKTKQEHYGLKVDGQFFVVKVVDGNELCAYDLRSGKSYQGSRW